MSVLDPPVSSEALNALAAQIAVVDRDGRIGMVNRSWEHFATRVGTTAPTTNWVGIDYLEVCRRADGPTGLEGPATADGLAGVLSGTLTDFSLEYPCDTPAGRLWFALHVTPRHDGRGAVVAHYDITERKRLEIERDRLHEAERAARRRATFLADAMETLERSLRFDVVCAALAKLAVEELADFAFVDVLDQRQRIVRLACAAADPADEHLAERARSLGIPPRPALHPSRHALERGATVAGTYDSADLRQSMRGEMAETIIASRTRSYLSIPMRGRLGTLGTLTLASRANNHYVSGPDREVAEDLARRAALALDNARMYSELEETARLLQEGLRPIALPEMPGIDVATAFRPAGSTLLVGGDFYDVVELGGANWGVTIGDVCGKGASAAATTALTRHTARAAAVFGATPAGVLRALDEAIVAESAAGADAILAQYCTAIYGNVSVDDTAGGATVELAGGGHVPPIVVRASGAVEIIPTGGSVLGVLAAPSIDEATIELDAGDALVLYTDGVLDAHAPERQLFPSDVAAALATHAGMGAAALTAAVEALALNPPGIRQRDDIAIVTLAVSSEF